MNINRTLNIIEKQIIAMHSDVSAIFAPPAKKDALVLFRNTFSDSSSTKQLSTLFKRYNGQLRDWIHKDPIGNGCVAQATLWNIVLDGEIRESCHFLSIQEILDTYTMMIEITSGTETFYCEGADSGIDPVYWSPSWIPFGTTAGGDLLCLDQKSRSVIYVCHEGSKRRIVADTLELFLDKWSEMLSETVIIESHEEKFIVSYKDTRKIVSKLNDFPWDIVPDRMDIQGFHLQHGFFDLVNIGDFF